MKLRGSLGVLLTAIAATLAVLALPTTASAAKVANPGPFNASVTGGFLRIKTQTFGFDPGNPITFAGTIDSQGNVNIPTSGQTYPPMPISAGGFDLTVRINPAQAITGTVNPLTGAVEPQIAGVDQDRRRAARGWLPHRVRLEPDRCEYADHRDDQPARARTARSAEPATTPTPGR